MAGVCPPGSAYMSISYKHLHSLIVGGSELHDGPVDASGGYNVYDDDDSYNSHENIEDDGIDDAMAMMMTMATMMTMVVVMIMAMMMMMVVVMIMTMAMMMMMMMAIVMMTVTMRMTIMMVTPTISLLHQEYWHSYPSYWVF